MPKAHHLHVCPEARDEVVSWLLMKQQLQLVHGHVLQQRLQLVYDLVHQQHLKLVHDLILLLQPQQQPCPSAGPCLSVASDPSQVVQVKWSKSSGPSQVVQVKVDACRRQVGQATVQVIAACQ
jgi:hypothetical protein